MLNVNKIFRGRKAMSEEDMRSGIVVGGPAALAEKLRVKHGSTVGGLGNGVDS